MNKSLRQQYLNEIGIQAWQLKSNADNFIFETETETETETEVEDIAVPIQAAKILTSNSIVSKVEIQEPSVIPLHGTSSSLDDRIKQSRSQSVLDDSLNNSIASCGLCASRKNRLKVLSGEGNAQAEVFFISEAPNAEEERDGHYLAGEIQSLFNKMLNCIGITDNYFFTGIVKCHSFEQYLVAEDEINNCRSHLIAQIEQIKPKILVLLGSIQAQAVLNTRDSFNQLRNKVHSVEINNQTYHAIVSYHPAYLSRNPLYKKEALKDLILIKSLLQ